MKPLKKNSSKNEFPKVIYVPTNTKFDGVILDFNLEKRRIHALCSQTSFLDSGCAQELQPSNSWMGGSSTAFAFPLLHIGAGVKKFAERETRPLLAALLFRDEVDCLMTECLGRNEERTPVAKGSTSGFPYLQGSILKNIRRVHSRYIQYCEFRTCISSTQKRLHD